MTNSCQTCWILPYYNVSFEINCPNVKYLNKQVAFHQTWTLLKRSYHLCAFMSFVLVVFKYNIFFMSLCFDINFKKNFKEVWGFYQIKEWLSTRLIKSKKKIHLKQCTVMLCYLNKKVNENRMIHIIHTYRNLTTEIVQLFL